jgi:hypothetical protein
MSLSLSASALVLAGSGGTLVGIVETGASFGVVAVDALEFVSLLAPQAATLIPSRPSITNTSNDFI